MYGTSWITSSLLAVVLGVALAAPAAAAMPDAWITTKTKLALLTTEGVSGTAIHVDTVLGRVTLYGQVGSAAEKATAERVTQQIDGVTGVRNLLRLTGTVATGARRLEAAMAARAIPGVRAIKDDLRLATATPA
jgi:osmotically-inducible protein OsmY